MKKEIKCKTFEDVHKLSGNFEFSTKMFKESKPMFNGYEEFIKYVEDRYGKEND